MTTATPATPTTPEATEYVAAPMTMYVMTANIPTFLTIAGASLFASDNDAYGWSLNRVREVLTARDDLPPDAQVNIVVAQLTDVQAAALLAQVSLLRPDLHDQAALLLLEMDAHGPHEPK